MIYTSLIKLAGGGLEMDALDEVGGPFVVTYMQINSDST